MPEKPSKPPLTIDHMITMAKKIALEHGGHTPTVIADGDTNIAVTQVGEMGKTHEQRALQLFLIGKLLAQEVEIGVLQQVFMITEGWMSIGTPEKEPFFPPSKDPQRKEVLSAAQVGVKPPISQAVTFEMKRDPLHGDLVGLEKLSHHTQEHEEEVSNPLLEAFVHDFLGLTHLPDDTPEQ